MGARYIVTGVQVAMLKSVMPKADRDKVLDEILEEQYIGESTFPIDYDAEKLANACSKY